MAVRHLALAPVLLFAVACADDSPDPTGGNAATGGGDPGGGGSGGQGGGATAQCAADFGADALEGGAFDTRFSIAGFTGHDGFAPAVHDLALDVDGSIVAAGRFQWFEGAPVPPLMRYQEGTWQPARTSWELEPPLDGFSAIAIAPDGALALATNDSFGEREGEIWIDDGTGLRSIGAFDGQVRSLAWYQGGLWVAGLFGLQGAPASEGLALWDDGAWVSVPGGALAGSAFELLVADDTLFVGGAFTSVGGAPASNVASFDGAAWTSLDFDGALAIYALARSDAGELYAGGAFGELSEAAGVARWDGAAWQTLGGGLAQYETRGVVTDLVAHGETLDATGCFTTAGGLPGAEGAIASRSVARWNMGAWRSLDEDMSGAVAPWFQPAVCGDEGPTALWEVAHQRLAHDGDQLVAGGFFAGVDGVLSQSIIVHDGAAWIAQGTSGIGIGGSIDQIAAGGDACDVYGLGFFSHVGGAPALGRVVHFNGSGWDVLSDPLPSDAYCPDLDVGRDGQLVVGCMVFPEGGDARGVILRRAGQSLVEVALEGLGPVSNVELADDGVLWIVGAGATGYLARLDGDELTIVEDGFDGGVNQLDVVSSDDIVVGGAFGRVGEVDAARIARWNGSEWSALGEGVPGQVLALARDASVVYVSTYDEGNGAYLLGAFDGASWQELAGAGSGLTPQSHFSFNALRVVGDALLLAGTAELDDGSGRGALVFRAGSFTALGGGVHAMGLGGAAITSDAVWIAGTIAQAGPPDALVATIGIARYQLP